MRENRLSGSMRGGVRRSLALGLSLRRLRLLYTGALTTSSAEARSVCSVGRTRRHRLVDALQARSPALRFFEE